MIGIWLVALVFTVPAAYCTVRALRRPRHEGDPEGSEEAIRRARSVVAIGALTVGLLLLLLAMFVLPTAAPPSMLATRVWDHETKPAIAWMILLLGWGLPFVVLGARLAAGRVSPMVVGMALILGWLPLWFVALALASPICYGMPLVFCGGLLGLPLAAAVLSPVACLAMGTRALVRGHAGDARIRASGARATTIWLAGTVACALLMGVWEPEYHPPDLPANRRLPANGVPIANITWTAKVEGYQCNPPSPSLPPVVDASGTVYALFFDRLVAVSGAGDVKWARGDLRTSKPPLPRPGGGLYVVVGGWFGPPRSMPRQYLAEVLNDGSVVRTWPYVETPLARVEGGFYSTTSDAVVAVGSDGEEEWRTTIPRYGSSPLGRPFRDTLGNILVPVQWEDRIHVVEPDGKMAGTLAGIDTEPAMSWIHGSYPASALGGQFITWDGVLIGLEGTGDTLWRREEYEANVAVAPDGSLRAIQRNNGREVFLVRLDTLGLPKWRRALGDPSGSGSADVWAGPMVDEDGASLVIVKDRAISVEDDGSLRWVSRPLPGAVVPGAAGWGPDGRVYVVRRIQEPGRCAAIVALEPPGRGGQL